MINFCYSLLTQIIFESFPVSSSSHVMLFQKFFFQSPATIEQSFTWLFHLPTLCALAVIFRERIFLLSSQWRIIYNCFVLGVIAECMTIVGVRFITYLPATPVQIGILITSLSLLSIRFHNKKYRPMRWSDAALIGFVQGCALLPGLSRLGITMVIAMWRGIAPRIAFLFSWMIASVPMTALALVGLIKNYPVVSSHVPCFLVGFLCAYGTMRLVYFFVTHDLLWRFGIYLLVPFIISFII